MVGFCFCLRRLRRKVLLVNQDTLQLLRPSRESSGDHIHLVERTGAGDVEGPFIRSAECEVLAVRWWTTHRDGPQMLALWAQDLDSGSGGYVEAAFVVDGYAVRECLDPTQAVVPRAPPFQCAEVAAVAHQAIRLDIPRDDMDAVRVADVPHLFVPAPLNPLRPDQILFYPQPRFSRRGVGHGCRRTR